MWYKTFSMPISSITEIKDNSTDGIIHAILDVLYM